MSSTRTAGSWDDVDLPSCPSAEERVYALAMARLDARDLEWWESDPPVAEVEPLTDEDLLEHLSSAPSAADLLLLESIDPMGLSSKAAVLDYLKAAERVDAYAASLKARARVALAGVESSAEVLAEIHVEKELAVATRSSQYSAGMAIERARVLTSTFPSFLAALQAGQISEGHCRVLVEKTRTFTNAEALAAVERVTLPKARRMTAGQFGREVARAVADVDPDATARYPSAWSTTPRPSPRSRPPSTPTPQHCARSGARPPMRSATPRPRPVRTRTVRCGPPPTRRCSPPRWTTPGVS